MELEGQELIDWGTGPHQNDIEPVQFPGDLYLHPHEFEWWYVAAQLWPEDAFGSEPVPFDAKPRWTLLFMVFKQRYLPSASPLLALSRVYDHEKDEVGRLHYDLGLDTCHYLEDRIREFVSFRLGSHSLHALPNTYRVSSNELDLTLTSPFRLRLGDRGVVDYGAGHAAYWTAPRLEVEGTYDQQPVKGRGWLERQWSNVSPNDKSWTFVAAQLSDGSRFSAFRFRDASQNEVTQALLLRPDQTDGEALTAAHAEIEIKTSKSPTGPMTTVNWPDVNLQLTFTSLNANQEIELCVLPSFGEYASRVDGSLSGETLSGWGIIEVRGDQAS